MPTTDDFLINTTVARNQGDPQITKLANGGFVVTWISNEPPNGNNIRAQVFAADGTPVDGTDILVSTSNAYVQSTPQIAALTNGGFVITWWSTDSNGLDEDIRAQVFAADGTPVDGTDFRVNTNLTSEAASQQITALSNGGFVITWETPREDTTIDITARVFGADGTPINGTEIVAGTVVSGPTTPQITALANGGFVIIWKSYVTFAGDNISAQVFAADGTPVGGTDILVSTSNTDSQDVPQITALSNGGFVITWQSSDNGTNYDIRAQVFAADGTPVDGTDILVSTSNAGDQVSPQITALANGGFVITWSSRDNGTNNDIRAQVFAADGTPVDGTDILVSTSNAGDQVSPQITALANGGFVITWQSRDNGTNLDIRARVFAADGTPVDGTDILVSTSNAGDQSKPDIMALPNGDFVITWQSNDNGSNTDIRARVFRADGTPGPSPTVINGTVGNDTLTGTAADETINGLGGADTLDGGDGTNTLNGGQGNDIYIIDATGTDTIVENANEGSDEVRSSLTYALGSNLENLVLTGLANINGTGNALDNVITGNSGDNTLTGGDGNDTLDGGDGTNTLNGGLGNDIYIIDATGTDTIVENAGEGTDTVYSSASSHTLAANVENLVLTGGSLANGTGNALDNTITGNSNRNNIDGGAGADRMIGGGGDDTYTVDNSGDYVVELAGEGTSDEVIAGVSYTLSANVENLRLSGTGNINGTGNAGINILTGNSGNNILDGGALNDQMLGGAGDDTYYVDNILDVVTENANEGTDTIQSSLNWTLDLNVENLTLTGSAALTGTGNGGANVIIGNFGANILDGAGGDDTLTGGTGDDTFRFNATSGADVITDFVAGGGQDRIDLQSFTSLWSLAQVIALGSQVGADSVITFAAGNTLTLRNVSLTALTADDFLLAPAPASTQNGTAGNDNIVGTSGNDTLDGLGGNDTINGGGGDDRIVYDLADTPSGVLGGSGSDTLVVLNGAALPISFNLAAQGFEFAERAYTDGANSYPWSSLIETYDAQWRLLQEDRTNDDGTRRISAFDTGNLQSWSSTIQEFNAGGQRSLQRTYNDDGGYIFTTWDVAATQSWSSYADEFNAAGQRHTQRIYNDDGSYRFYYWDATNAQTWLNFDEEFNAAGQRHTQRIYNDDGSYRLFYWDTTNVQTWREFDDRYNAAGARTQQTIINDDGTSSQQYWDVGAVEDYSTYVDYFNAAGQRVEQRIFFDQGGNIGGYNRIFHDPTNAHPWLTRTQVYDAAGQLLSTTDVPG